MAEQVDALRACVGQGNGALQAERAREDGPCRNLSIMAHAQGKNTQYLVAPLFITRY